MKRFLTALGLLALFFIPGCEKDDLCDEAARTTPRLIVNFFDFANPTTPKNVNSLEIIGDGASDPLGTFNGVSQVELPLRTTDDFTRYSLRINSNNEAFDNTDYLQFNYTRDNIYVSRACGYKTVFDLDGTSAYMLTDAEPADGLWISHVFVNTLEIDNENETHVNIYF